MKNEGWKMRGAVLIILLGVGFMVSPIQASYDFLFNKFGVRAVGMGGAFTGLAEGSEAIFYNWAKKPTLKNTYMSLEHGARMGTPFYAYSVQNLFHIPDFRFGYIHTSINDIKETQMNAFNHPEATGNSFAFALHSFYGSWRTDLLGFQVGVLGHYFQESLKDQTGTSSGLSFAAYKELQPNQAFNIGASIKNAISTGVRWSTGHTDIMQPIIATGISSKLFNNKLTLCTDYQYEKGRGVKLFAGIEYWLLRSREHETAFAIRGGFRERDISLGLGMNMLGVIIDYAFIQPQHKFMELEHRFSISLSAHPFIPAPNEHDYGFPNNINKNDLNSSDVHLASNPNRAIQNDPKMLMFCQFSGIEDTHLQIDLQKIFSGSTLIANRKTVYKAKSPHISQIKELDLPLDIIIYPSKQKTEAIFVRLQKNNNSHLVITGSAPTQYKIMIEDQIITHKASGNFYHKILKSDLAKNSPLDFLIFIK